MKKFYYRKEDSLDKTPIILRLDRRHTVNVNKDGVKQEVGRYSSRATSISSLDQINNVPTLPRARTREVTKSLSEDIFCNYSTPSTVLITETELSSSWLYKNMKANCRDANEYQTPKASSSKSATSQESLSPVVLQDPKMKPIPVPIRPRRERTSSVCCHMAIIILITICTLGFMSTIGGIVYLEVFSTKESVTSPTYEVPVDSLDVFQIAQDGEMAGTTEIERHKAVVNAFENESAKSHGTEDVMIIDKDGERKAIHFLDFGKPPSTELTQFIDRSKTEITLHKDNSARYEEKSSNSVTYEESYSMAQHVVDIPYKQFDSNENEMHGKSNQNANNLTEDVDEKQNENIESLATFVIHSPNDSTVEVNQNKDINDFGPKFSDLNRTNGLEELKPDTNSKSEVSEPKSDLNELEDISRKSSADFKNRGTYQPVDTEMQSDSHDKENPVSVNVIESLDDNIVENSQGSAMKLNNIGESQISVGNDVNFDESSYDDSMIEVIDEPIRRISGQETDVIFNRNGDMSSVSEKTNLRTSNPSRIMIVTQRPVLNANDFSQRFQHVAQNRVNSRPADIKVSLAEAMKHLQVLDVKLPSSRTKSSTLKVKTTKPKTRLDMQKEMEAIEQKRYLQKLRRIFFEQMQ